MIDLSKDQIAHQLNAADSLETKTIGLLALLPVITALFVTVDRSWWAIVPGLMAVISLLFGFRALKIDDYQTGPNAIGFFDAYYDKTEEQAYDGMLWQMGWAINTNNALLLEKGRQFRKALIALLVTIVAMMMLLLVNNHMGGMLRHGHQVHSKNSSQPEGKLVKSIQTGVPAS